MHSDELEWGLRKPLVKDDDSSPPAGNAAWVGVGGRAERLGCFVGALGTNATARLLISHRGESVATSEAANALSLSHH